MTSNLLSHLPLDEFRSNHRTLGTCQRQGRQSVGPERPGTSFQSDRDSDSESCSGGYLADYIDTIPTRRLSARAVRRWSGPALVAGLRAPGRAGWARSLASCHAAVRMGPQSESKPAQTPIRVQAGTNRSGPEVWPCRASAGLSDLPYLHVRVDSARRMFESGLRVTGLSLARPSDSGVAGGVECVQRCAEGRVQLAFPGLARRGRPSPAGWRRGRRRRQRMGVMRLNENKSFQGHRRRPLGNLGSRRWIIIKFCTIHDRHG